MVDGACAVTELLLHGAQRTEHLADLIAATHGGDGIVQAPGGNALAQRNDLLQRLGDGTNQQLPKPPQHRHGGQQRHQGQPARALVTLHARPVGRLRLVELQAHQRLNVGVGLLVQLVRVRRQALGTEVVEPAQRGQRRCHGLAQVAPPALAELLRQGLLGGATRHRQVALPQLINGGDVLLNLLGCLPGREALQPHDAALWIGTRQGQLHLQLVGQHQVGDLRQAAHWLHAVFVDHAQAFLRGRQPADAHGRQQRGNERGQQHQRPNARADAQVREQISDPAQRL